MLHAAPICENLDAGFDEVEAACFPGRDMKRVYSAISPRVFEAALAEACQVLVPGHYLGILHANEHYIPLAADFSNIVQVLDELGLRARKAAHRGMSESPARQRAPHVPGFRRRHA